MGGHADGLPTEIAQVLGRLVAGVGLAAGHHHPRAGEHETLGSTSPMPLVPPVTMTVRSVMSKRLSKAAPVIDRQ